MPHRCTRCGKIYEDGDVRILNGCECGNNKFEYIPRERKERKEGEKIEIVRIISPGCYEINLENAFKKEGIILKKIHDVGTCFASDGRLSIAILPADEKRTASMIIGMHKENGHISIVMKPKKAAYLGLAITKMIMSLIEV